MYTKTGLFYTARWREKVRESRERPVRLSCSSWNLMEWICEKEIQASPHNLINMLHISQSKAFSWQEQELTTYSFFIKSNRKRSILGVMAGAPVLPGTIKTSDQQNPILLSCPNCCWPWGISLDLTTWGRFQLVSQGRDGSRSHWLQNHLLWQKINFSCCLLWHSAVLV